MFYAEAQLFSLPQPMRTGPLAASDVSTEVVRPAITADVSRETAPRPGPRQLEAALCWPHSTRHSPFSGFINTTQDFG